MDAAVTANERALKFLGVQMAVPPVLAAYIYDKEPGYGTSKHPTQRIFESSHFATAKRQLEVCGMSFDQCRALYGLPVVPHGMTVGEYGDCGVQWYRALRFPEDGVESLRQELV